MKQVVINTSIRKATIFGLTMFIVLVLFSIIWAAYSPLASAVIANGALKAHSNTKSIQHLAGGIVAKILVKDGQSVSVGETLVELDPVQAKASFEVINSALFAALALKYRLIAERDELSSIDYGLFAKSDITLQNQSIIKAQTSLFTARRSVLQSQQQILQQQVDHFHAQIEGLQSQRNAKEKQLDIANQELVEHRKLLSNGLVDKARVLQLERELAELTGEHGELFAEISAAKISIDEKKLEILRVSQSFSEQVLEQLQETESQIMDLSERKLAASQTLEHTSVVAPVDGTVVDLQVHTVGGVVSPGQLLLEIVPKDDELIVEGQLSPADVDDVSIGLFARVKLSGLKQRTTPELKGVVAYISADSFLDERTGNNFYKVKVSVLPEELEKLNGTLLVPGMPIELFIQTGERTALEYLFQPLTDSIDRAWRES